LIAGGYIDAMKIGAITVSAAMLAAAGGGYFVDDIPVPRMNTSMRGEAACNIKGNISIDTGERIYHMPGQKYYDRTRISPQYGEHWFCSEAEAQAAGWRKARE
jgi:hypothetical protein